MQFTRWQLNALINLNKCERWCVVFAQDVMTQHNDDKSQDNLNCLTYIRRTSLELPNCTLGGIFASSATKLRAISTLDMISCFSMGSCFVSPMATRNQSSSTTRTTHTHTHIEYIHSLQVRFSMQHTLCLLNDIYVWTIIRCSETARTYPTKACAACPDFHMRAQSIPIRLRCPPTPPPTIHPPNTRHPHKT